VTASLTYSQYRQILIPVQADIWTKENRYNIISDIRFISYPSAICGLGGKSDPNEGVTIYFSGLKIHQTIMKALSDNIYVGIGYYFDKFWNIKALDKVTRVVNSQILKELGKKLIEKMILVYEYQQYRFLIFSVGTKRDLMEMHDHAATSVLGNARYGVGLFACITVPAILYTAIGFIS
jgi:hypothetical protein